MDATSRGRTTAFDFVNVRILETMCAPSGLGDMSTVSSFPAKHRSRRDNTLFSLTDRGGFFRWYDRHGLEAQAAFPFGFGKPPECSFVVFFSLLPMHVICVAPRKVKTSLDELGVGFMCCITFSCIANSSVEMSPLATSMDRLFCAHFLRLVRRVPVDPAKVQLMGLPFSWCSTIVWKTCRWLFSVEFVFAAVVHNMWLPRPGSLEETLPPSSMRNDLSRCLISVSSSKSRSWSSQNLTRRSLRIELSMSVLT